MTEWIQKEEHNIIKLCVFCNKPYPEKILSGHIKCYMNDLKEKLHYIDE